jgi:2-polyprenyl-3-methyl-5-hydroxy-6-metoxy-1,4-benzoquinol methylase
LAGIAFAACLQLGCGSSAQSRSADASAGDAGADPNLDAGIPTSADPIRVQAFTRTEGFRHDSIGAGLALYLNRVADVDVLGVTLSKEQLAVARQRAADAGVSDRVKFELMDWRDVEGTFDRVVSIGMFEHLGTAYFQTFFAKVKELLAPDGVSLIHTMGRMGKPGTTDKFMQKYIFPGGYLPSLSIFASRWMARRAAVVSTKRCTTWPSAERASVQFFSS